MSSIADFFPEGFDRTLAPFVPTDYNVIDAALEMAELQPGETFYDLGCGDGRVVIAAALKHDIYAKGIERKRSLVRTARCKVKDNGLEDRVEIIHDDILNDSVNLSDADVVYTYLVTHDMELLRPKFERELQPYSRIVSYDFPISGWENYVKKPINGRHLYLYKMDSVLKI